MKFEELETVRVLKDFPEHKIKKSEIGTVVFVFTIPNEAYEVEFSGEKGVPKATFPILPDDIEKMTTLREKYGFQPDTSGFGSGLIEWYNEVIEKELSELDARDVAKMIRQKGVFKGEVRKFAIKKSVELFIQNPFDGETFDGDLLKVLLSVDLMQVSQQEKTQMREIIARVEKKELTNEWYYDGDGEEFEENLLQLKIELLQDEMTPYHDAKEKISIALKNVAQMNQIVGSEWKEQAFKDYLEAYRQFNPTWDEFFKLLEIGEEFFQEYKNWKKTELSKDE